MSTLDVDQASQHWGAWFGGHVWPDGSELVVVSEQSGTFHWRRVPVGDLDAYLVAAEALLASRPGCNLYVGCCPQRPDPANGRGTAAGIAGGSGLWMDVDTTAGEHGMEGLPSHQQGLDLAEQICAELGVGITALVETGGGWHVWIGSDRVLTPGEMDQALEGFKRFVEARFVAAGVTPDTHPLQPGALLRIPGTRRTKPGQAPTAVEMRRVGGRSDFSTLLDRLPPPPPRPAPSARRAASPFTQFAQRVAPSALLPLMGATLVREARNGVGYWRLEPTSSPFSVVTYPPADDGAPGRALVVGVTLSGLWSSKGHELSPAHSTSSTGLLSGVCGGDPKLLRRVLALTDDGRDLDPLATLLSPMAEAGDATAMTPADVAAALPTGARTPRRASRPAPAVPQPAATSAVSPGNPKNAWCASFLVSAQARRAQSSDTTASTEVPTEPPTEPPTEADTTTPTEVPTEPPTEADAEVPAEVPTGTIWLPAGTEDLSPLADWLDRTEGQRRALDTETTGLDTRAPAFACKQIALGAEDGSAVVIDGTDPDLVRRALAESMQRDRWYAHNAVFDADVLAVAYGVEPQLWDTITAQRCIRPDAGSTRLKALRPETQRHQDALRAHFEATAGRKLGAAGEENWLPRAIATLPVDDPYVLAYVAGDAVECARLAGVIAERAEKIDAKATVEAAALDEPSPARVRAAVVRLCRLDMAWRDVTHRGIAIDRAGLEDDAERMAAEVAAAIDRAGLDLSSNGAATYSWVAEQGVTLPLTKGGSPSLASKTRDMAVVPAEAEAVWEWFCALRDTVACRGKVGEILRAERHGRVHPQIAVNGAQRTGRMSISGPALQNLAERLKPFFLADEGRVLVGLDLDSVEPHITAALSGDEELIKTLGSDVDCYMRAALSAWPGECSTPEGARRMRKRAKPLFLAQEYGQTVHGLARAQGISHTEAEHLRRALFAPYPTLARWLQTVDGLARRSVQLWTWGGRPLPVWALKGAPFKAVNALVQGSAADAFDAMLVKLIRRLPEIPDARLYLPVHDEIVIEVPEGAGEEAVALLDETMHTTVRGIEIGGRATVLGPRLAHA